MARVWLPAPSLVSDYQQSIENNWAGNAKVMRLATDPKYGAVMLYAEFAEGEAAPMVELTSRFKTQDRAVDWSKKVTASEDAGTLKSFTSPTDLMPTDGIVKETALEITKGQGTDLDKTGPSTTGSSTTPSASPRCVAAGSATSRRCSRPRTSAASAPI